VGFIIAGIKELQAAKVGDTVTHVPNNARPAAGAARLQGSAAAGVCRIVPVEANQYDALRDALEKLKLNDASLIYEPEVSPGAWFWLSLRLSRPAAHGDRAGASRARVRHGPHHHGAFGVYEVMLRDGTVHPGRESVQDAGAFRIEELREPIVTVLLYMPQEYVGAVITLCTAKRGTQINMAYHGHQVMLTYEMPLAEIVLDFFDRLKSSRAATPRWTTSSRSTARPTWSRSTC
jgi:GTP-binding protein LepA